MAQLSSGIWSGYYEQWGEQYPQEATLEFADGLIRGDGSDGIGTFTIEGEYRVDSGETRLGWIKTYDGAHSVLYLGVLEGESITGEWKLTGGSGSFALRASGSSEDSDP
jgi:hypothetical protein